MKRILPLILAAAMTLTAGTAALADNVSDALEKAATMTNDELYAKAQEEMAAGAQLQPSIPIPPSLRREGRRELHARLPRAGWQGGLRRNRRRPNPTPS